MDPRTQAVKVLCRVIQHRASLSSALSALIEPIAVQDRGLLQELSYGTLRYYPQLLAYLNLLLSKPLKAKDSDIQATLLLGLYQLLHTRIPDHAAISATVEVTRHLKKNWATKLVNGILRRFQRESDSLTEKLLDKGGDEFRFAHPQWLVQAIRLAWAEQAEQVLEANNSHPPFTVRLNLSRLSNQNSSRTQYRQQLRANNIESGETKYSETGLTLDRAVDVKLLPGFDQGLVSVQDEAAQMAAPLLQLKPGQRVLDACCAPGGKTCHILEHVTSLRQLVALDIEPSRLDRVRQNLRRLGFTDARAEPVKLICGNALEPKNWWNGEPFDRILLDAPCSATGVIRRHPDIKILRSPTDIAKLAQLQRDLLRQLWPLLAPEGVLVYATCSIMPEENTGVIEQFIASQTDAIDQPIDADWGLQQPCGRQLLPQTGGHDGFYYACLRKGRSDNKNA